MPFSPCLEPSPQEVVAALLGELQREFGAVVVDARDDTDGSISVDVQIAAGDARRLERIRLREQRSSVIAASRACHDVAAGLVERAAALVREAEEALRIRNEYLVSVRLHMDGIRASAQLLRGRPTPPRKHSVWAT